VPGRFAVASALVAGSFALPAFGSLSSGTADVRWRPLVRVAGVVDVVGPRSDRRFVVASHQGLFLLRRNGALTPFARGSGGYPGAAGEPYVAIARERRLAHAGCSFRRDDVYALDPSAAPGIMRVDRSGTASRFLDFPSGAFPSTIAFDTVGRFGYRLLVTAQIAGRTTLYAVNCRGRSVRLVRRGPKVEGGAAVAPADFGRFGGQLVAADEVSGRIYAFSAAGRVRTVAAPAIPRGGDIGVESVGFVPREFTRRGAAYLADLGAPGSPTQGDDSVLTLGGSQLLNAGVRPGDLLVASEGGGVTVSVRCRARGCVAQRIGRALEATHGEGHITFTRG
jgi:hypothetical protein